MTDIEGFLCAFLRGENPAWPDDQDDALAASLIERATYHGVLALLHERLKRDPAAGKEWPHTVLQACHESALAQAMWELRHRALLQEVLPKLASVGVRPVMFKGTALAYTLYPEGTLRSRGDTDLIIPHQARALVADTISKLGFESHSGVSGECISYQASFTRRESAGDTHTLDVHWRINNSEILSRLFTYEELLRHAQPVPPLGPDALAAGPLHALLLACMHRAGHKHSPYYVEGEAHFGGDRVVWLYDIHLLSASFSPDDWDTFVRMAAEKGFCSVCLEGLEHTRAALHTAVPQHVLATLGQSGKGEVLARYLDASALHQQWMDFCALPGLTQKLRFVGETLFPSADYMRQKYPGAVPGWLPWLYLKRAAGGIAKRTQRGVRSH